MSYRFVKITSFYRDYLKYYYSKNKYIVNRPYLEQYNHLMSDSFAWANFYQKNLINLGIEAFEIVDNAEPLQQTWANEHCIEKSGIDLVTQQIKTIKPDVVFIQDAISFDSQWTENLRKEVGSIKLIIGFCCSPFNNNKLRLYKNFDFMITCSDFFLDEFNKSGIKAYKLYHAFEKTILNNLERSSLHTECDLIFIGSLIGGNEQHNLRAKIVEEVLSKDIDFKIHSHLKIEPKLIMLLKQSGYISSKLLIKLGLKKLIFSSQYLRKFAVLNEMIHNPTYSDKLKAVAKEPLYGMEMYNALSKAKMGLNIHGGFGGGKFAANIRLFEVTGVGSCLITDWKKNLNDILEIDKEVVAFNTAEECIEKVKWLINHPSERKAIADAGQKRVLKDHTFELRAKQLDEIIRKELNKK